MLNSSALTAGLLLTITLSSAKAQEYRLELIDGPPEADDVSAAFVEELAPTGVRVKRGANRTVCELWFCREWDTAADFKATPERLYPFTPGQLIGLLHFRRRGSDFRDQTVGRGWYTLRFGLQPVDGNHVGTSPTRDFLVMVDVEKDSPDRNWDVGELMQMSAEAAGSNHPAMICLQSAGDSAEMELRHDESRDWWILHVVGEGRTGDTTRDLPVDLIVVGHATE